MPGSILMALLTLITKLFNVVCAGNGIWAPWSHRGAAHGETPAVRGAMDRDQCRDPFSVLSPFLSQAHQLCVCSAHP